MALTTEDLFLHMYRVQVADRDLRELRTGWRTIESAAEISCPEDVAPILPTLVRTGARFEALQGRLIEQMVAQGQGALGETLAAKAQCAIDILVRNLFERTADVGFLATDEVVRWFCALSEADRAASRATMVARLRAYQAQYSVYEDILLLGPDGTPLAQLDETAALQRSQDVLLAKALASPHYVEQFGPSDLVPGGATALLYAHRIDAPDSGRPLGVLVLRFGFEQEMKHVFEGMDDERHDMAILLVGPDQRVLASNDPSHVPLGARLRTLATGSVGLTAFAGREYVAVRCASHGYQGYAGPGWQAQAMVSLLTAFRAAPNENATSTQGAHEVPLDDEHLLAINRDADAINRDLRRVVWNGQLMAGRQDQGHLSLKAVLGQLGSAGVRIRQRVAHTIQDLASTSLARARNQSVDLARLAADVMDRNLYERANDCRWWALSPALQRALGAAGEPIGAAALQALLDHINSLYTVYNRLVLFDAEGLICGASRQGDEPAWLGQPVAADWLEAVRRLDGPQRYAVTAFVDTPLHDGGPTYTYLAALHNPADRRFLGGIALVFNAAHELRAMLRDVLGERRGFAAFVDAQQRVLACTDDRLPTGAPLPTSADEAMWVYQGAHHVCARATATGYREFKRVDGYSNGVSAVVALRLGDTERRRLAYRDIELSTLHPPRHDATEVAIFQVGAMRCGVAAEAVMQAVSRDGLVPTPSGARASLGLLEVSFHGRRDLVRVVCARRLLGVDYPARAGDGVVLVLRDPVDQERPALGLKVDDILTVLSFDPAECHAAPMGVQGFAPWMRGMLDCRARRGELDERVLVQLIDAGRLTGTATLPTGPALALA